MAKTLTKDIAIRIYLLYVGILICAFLIAGRIFQIQVYQGDHWKEKSKQQSFRYVKVKADRGNIYSENKKLLATSVPIYDIYWDSKVVNSKTFYKYIDSLAIGFSQIFPDVASGNFKSKLENAFGRKLRYVKIRKNVSYSQLKKIEKLPIFSEGKYRGGLIKEKFDYRKRPYKLLAKRTIGKYNKSQKKYIVGLEGAYNDYLRGDDGIRLKQKTSGGWKPMYLFDKTIKEPVNGIDVVTTLDVNLQDVAENSLYSVLMEHQADWGCAVLMEVKTGHIKAIANLKLDTSTKTYYEGYNYAIGSAVEPGSTFKLASMMVALEHKKVKPNDVVHTGKGYYTYYGKTIHDSHGYGDITASEVLEKSSNVGVFKIILNGYESEPAKFINEIHKMGLNDPVGIEIKGEANPYIKTPKDSTWSGLSLPWMSIGYELRMTPLQVLTFYNAVANNGTKVKPQFVKELSRTGVVQKSFDTEIMDSKICSQKTIDNVKNMLEGVVQKGTATMLKNSPYPIAGKTGTAQISGKGGYNKRNYQASFVGYFPADDPKYSCIVVVNNPSKGKYYASTVAVPVFKDIADKIYATDLDIQVHGQKDTLLQLPNSKVGAQDDIRTFYRHLDFSSISSKSESPYVAAYFKNDSVRLYNRQLKHDLMPNVKFMTAKDAVFLLEKMGLRVKIHGVGKVIEQSIKANSKIRKGDVVRIKLGV